MKYVYGWNYLSIRVNESSGKDPKCQISHCEKSINRKIESRCVYKQEKGKKITNLQYHCNQACLIRAFGDNQKRSIVCTPLVFHDVDIEDDFDKQMFSDLSDYCASDICTEIPKRSIVFRDNTMSFSKDYNATHVQQQNKVSCRSLEEYEEEIQLPSIPRMPPNNEDMWPFTLTDWCGEMNKYDYFTGVSL